MKVYKGTDKDMKCRGMQYEIGKTVTDTGAIRCGNNGFHSCEVPFDVLKYYPNVNGNRYFEANADGVIDKKPNEDSKIASSKFTILKEISFEELKKEQIKYTKEKAKSVSPVVDGSNLAGGDGSNIAGGYSSIIVGRNGCRVKAGINSVIILTEYALTDDGYKPVCVKAEIVDGVRIKAGIWYELKNGEFVESLSK